MRLQRGGLKMGWRQDYPHERRKIDPSAPTTKYPQLDDTLSEAMRLYLEGRGLDYTCAVRAGWYPARYVGPRIIIPCLRTDGGIWWQARTLTDHPKRWMGSGGYKHDAVCYIPGGAKSTTVVCEGPMDALAAAGLGYRAIAILGASPPPVVFDHVARLAGPRAIILPDMDRVAAWHLVQQQLGQRGVRGMLFAIPTQKDLAALPPDERRDFLAECT